MMLYPKPLDISNSRLAAQGRGIPVHVVDRLLDSCWQVQCLRNPKRFIEHLIM